jgi:hypothetical protein
VPGKDDNTCRAIAEQIHHVRPQWLVIWGSFSRRFWAFPLFEMHPRLLVCAWYPDALIARMDDAERRYRIRPEEAISDDATSQ